MQAGVEDVFQTFEINDLQPNIRNTMIRRNVLAEIERKTGTTILVKGRFYPPGAPRTEDPSIHLRVSCGQHNGKACFPSFHLSISAISASQLVVSASVFPLLLSQPFRCSQCLALFVFSHSYRSTDSLMTAAALDEPPR
jgi:hypothetical protein